MAIVKQKIGIIGGTGKMGKWFAQLFINKGYDVFVSGRSTTLTAVEIAGQCDVVIISVPIDKTIEVIKEIGPLISEHGVMMDLTSIKAGPISAMLEFSRAEVVGIHPLFGPSDIGREGLNIALCPGRGEIALKWIRDLFINEGFHTFCLEAKEHDKIMGLIQGVNHFSTIALAMCIKRSEIKMEDIVNISTRTFTERLDRIKAILEQPTELFRSLIMNNPYAEDFLDSYKDSVMGLIQITKDNKHEEFDVLFKELNEIFGD